MKRTLSHLDAEGRARMVNVGKKPATSRRAVARGFVSLSREAFRLVQRNAVEKGDVLTVAQVAGIQAGKRAFEWIPLAHPIPLDGVSVRLALLPRLNAIVIEAEAASRAATGVEMEAMVAVTAAALTVYDMCKAADRAIEIGPIHLVHKSGGKSGAWSRK